MKVGSGGAWGSPLALGLAEECFVSLDFLIEDELIRQSFSV